ncbi:MAG: SRPBCC family protein [Colwellia sp.]|nr:SRPBCC family protein [Colwellia sp.]
MITINVTQQVLAPVALVNQALLEHSKLDRFFNAKIKQVKDENDGELVGGKGVVRQISIGKIVFEEQIISASIEHICYRIIGNWPVSDHQGDICLTSKVASKIAPQPSYQPATQVSSQEVDIETTQLDYVIRFNSPRWLPGFLLKFFVERDIMSAMEKLAQHFAANSTSRSAAKSTGESV